MRLMGQMRQSIIEDRFPDFVTTFMKKIYPKRNIPQWAVAALESVGINLNELEEPMDSIS